MIPVWLLLWFFLKFWAHKILPKFWRNFWRNFLQYFGKISSPLPLPQKKKKKKEKIFYTALCKIYILAKILIIPLEILSSANSNYFNGGMFICASNMIRPMWYESHIMLSQKFVKISHVPGDIFSEIVVFFFPNFFGHFGVIFWRNLRCRNTTYDTRIVP